MKRHVHFPIETKALAFQLIADPEAFVAILAAMDIWLEAHADQERFCRDLVNGMPADIATYGTVIAARCILERAASELKKAESVIRADLMRFAVVKGNT